MKNLSRLPRNIICSVFLLLLQWNATAQLVSTFAGSGTAGSLDGTGTSATFNTPYGVVFDAAGNLFVSDGGAHRIRKITPSGVVSTFAGSGTASSVDGTGTSASFNAPYSIAIDAADNLYVADLGGHKIRKITPAGVVTTIAGSGSPGSSNGTGASASFYYPHGIAVDVSGNVFVADQLNYKIRKITPSGNVTTFAGTGFFGSADGAGTSASFGYVTHLTIDGSDNLYVCDGNKIRKITSMAVVSTVAGSTDGYVDGSTSIAKFGTLYGIAVDDNGNLFVTDQINRRIRKVSASGNVSTIAGDGNTSYADGMGTAASFNEPFGLVVDGSGNLFVADVSNHRIRKITLLPEIKISQGVSEIISGAGVYDFGNVAQSTSSSVITFTVQNEQNANNVLLLTGSPIVSISGVDASHFTINSNGTSTSIALGSSTTFSITFTPSTLGSKSATVALANNDYNESSYTFTVNGNATINTAIIESKLPLFQVVPNPTLDRIRILSEQDLKLELFDAQGRKVLQQALGSSSEEISLSHLKPGLYTIRCQNDKNQYQDFKIVKE